MEIYDSRTLYQKHDSLEQLFEESFFFNRPLSEEQFSKKTRMTSMFHFVECDVQV